MDYCVATDGNNGNPGTLAEPWLMVQHGCDQLLAGDTLVVRGGIYNEDVGLTGDGTAEAKINVEAYPGEIPIIDGGGILPLNAGHLFRLDGDYCVVNGLEVKDSNGGGIELQGKNNIAKDCYVHLCDNNGITAWGDNSTVDGCRAYKNSLETNGVGINIFGINDHTGDPTEGHDCTIKNCIAWNNSGEGISASQAHNAIIEDNIVYDNEAVEIYITDTNIARVQRNLVYQTGDPSYDCPGIAVADEIRGGKGTAENTGLTIINNLVVGTRRCFYFWVEHPDSGLVNTLVAHNMFVNSRANENMKIIASPGNHYNSHIMNNVFIQEDEVTIAYAPDESEIAWSYNLWSKAPGANATGIGDIVVDPFLSRGGIIAPSQIRDWFYRLAGIGED